MLIGISIGDAFGAGYEFAYDKIEKYQNVEQKFSSFGLEQEKEITVDLSSQIEQRLALGD